MPNPWIQLEAPQPYAKEKHPKRIPKRGQMPPLIFDESTRKTKRVRSRQSRSRRQYLASKKQSITFRGSTLDEKTSDDDPDSPPPV